MSHAPQLRRLRLALDSAADPATLDRVAAIAGIVGIRPDGDGRAVTLSYDPDRATLGELEPLLSAAGLVLSPRRLDRWRRAWTAFQDDNIRANTRLRHQCCCTPPDQK